MQHLRGILWSLYPSKNSFDDKTKWFFVYPSHKSIFEQKILNENVRKKSNELHIFSVQTVLVEWHIIHYAHELLVSVLRYPSYPIWDHEILHSFIYVYPTTEFTKKMFLTSCSLRMRIGCLFYQWRMMKQISASAYFHFARGIDKHQITT